MRIHCLAVVPFLAVSVIRACDSTVNFSVEPTSGPRSLWISCTAWDAEGGALPEGTYRWEFDGVPMSGPLESHQQLMRVFNTAGIHSVALTVEVTGVEEPIIGLNAATGEPFAEITVWPQVSGHIRDAGGVPIEGATLSADSGGTSDTTNEDGAYCVDVPYDWSGTISVSHPDYNFNPSSISPTNVQADLVLDFTATTTDVTIIEVGDTWRYLKGRQGTPPSDWTAIDFDDGNWDSGPTGIGYGDDDDATILGDMAGSYLTVYARRSFQVPDAGTVSSATLEIDYDDGFVAYLNGVEIVRRNMGLPGTATTYDMPSDDGHEAGEAEVVSGSVAGILVTGTNVLAVEIHNVDIDSSDLSFIPRVILEAPPIGGNDPPTASPQAVSTAVNEALPITLGGSDPDEDALTFIIVGLPGHGTLRDGANGQAIESGDLPYVLTDMERVVTYAPDADYEGQDSFAFKVNDGQADSGSATVAVAVGSWVPPVGIPTPAFGITQKHTMYQGQSYDYGSGAEPYRNAGNGPYTHYVDNTHPYSTDVDNPYGTPAKPRNSIPRYPNAGDVIEIHGGPYSPNSDRFWIQGTGTASEPIFVRGVDPQNAPALLRRVHLLGQYIILENVICQASGIDVRPVLGWGAHHIAIRQTEVAGEGVFKSYHSILVTSDDASLPVYDVVLYGNNVHDNGQYDAGSEDDTPAFSIQRNAYNIWVVDNVANHSGGDGVILAHGADFSTHHVYIGRNVLHHHRENAVDIKECEDIVVSQNVMYGYEPTSSSSGEAVVIHYGARRIWLLNNDISDAQFGICSTGCFGLYMLGNVVHDIRDMTDQGLNDESPHRGGIGLRWYNSGYAVAAGNTIYDCVTGIGADIGGTAVEIVNNLISTMDAGENGYHLTIFGESSAEAGSTVDYDLFHQPGGSVRIFWNFGPLNVAQFRAESGKGAECLEGDPRFVGAANGDFHIQAGSDAIDAGCPIDTYQTFSGLYGIDIAVDWDETPREQGSDVDIGADETTP